MIVYTVGTFDLLHVGHLALLNHCKSLGDILAVGVASDDVVNQYKPNIQLRGVLLIKIGVTPQTGAFEMDWQNPAIKLFDAFGRSYHIGLFDIGQDRHITRR